MYHIPDDIRAQRSAELLYHGLLGCLEHAQITDISVTAVAKKSGCGRSTFYRLFDNPTDIAEWKCDQIMQTALQEATTGKDFGDAMLCFISSWRKHAPLIGALHRSSLDAIIYQVQISHIDDIQALFLKGKELSARQQTHLAYILAALIHATFQIWSSDMTQSSEKLLEAIKDAIGELDMMFNPGTAIN